MRRKLKNIGKTLLLLNDTPHRIALGMAIGLLIAWTPTVGIQTLLALPLAWLLRANLVAAVIGIYLSNPVTFLPMYWLQFRVGAGIIRDAPTIEEFRQLMGRASWSEWTFMMTTLGGRTLLAMLVGGLLLGVLTAIPGYYSTHWVIRRYRREQTSDVD